MEFFNYTKQKLLRLHAVQVRLDVLALLPVFDEFRDLILQRRKVKLRQTAEDGRVELEI